MKIETKGLAVDLDGRVGVLRDVDLEMQRGEVFGLLGPNGAGKSTLLRALGGLLPASSGGVFLDGKDLAKLSRKEVARCIAFLPQDVPADLPFTALEIALMGRSPHLGSLGLDGPEDRKVAMESLEAAEAAGLAGRSFHRLSGGERQRILLARAIAQEAPIWLLDEPTTHLDLGHQRLALELARAHADQGGTVVVVLHDLGQASRICDRVALLVRGGVVAVGSPREVLTEERLQTSFGVSFSWVEAAGVEGPLLVPRW